VADTRTLEAATGWRARTSWHEGLARLAGWLREARAELGATANSARERVGA
jgi:CDP-paratose 2-epimerase